MSKPSGRQKAILEFIGQHSQEKGYPPSVREIAAAVGLRSPSTVHSHLERLQELGFLKKNPSQPRTIELQESANPYLPFEENLLDQAVVNIPVLGEITAGQPIFAYENIETNMPLPADLFRGAQHFILKVEGDSMIGAGIYSGDLAVIRHQKTAENGEVVVALMDNDATLKKFYHEGKKVRLQPENPTMEPIYTEEVEILGKLVALLRVY